MFEQMDSRRQIKQPSLKEIVYAFRVQELQTICHYANVSKNGKKGELLQRAIRIIQDPSPILERQIRELHRARFPPLDTANRSASTSVSTRSRTLALSHTGSSSATNSFVPVSVAAYGKPLTTSASYQHHQPDYHHQSSAFKPMAMLTLPVTNQVPYHPDVKFEQIPFYDQLDQLTKPLSLAARDNSSYQDTYFTFHLSPEQTCSIKNSPMVPSYGFGGQLMGHESAVQIQMRLCLLETTCAQDDNYPPFVHIRLNGRVVELPPLLQQSKAGQTPRRMPKPLNITKYVRLTPSLANHVQIQWSSEFGRNWVVATFLVRQNCAQDLLKRLKDKGTRNPDHTKAIVKDKLRVDLDSEIATTSLRVSLCCPLGKMRMQHPARSTNCSHVQCFDANMYIMMNEKRPNWNCPVCDKKAHFRDLLIDGYFAEILQSSSYDCTEVLLFQDSSWAPIDGERTVKVENTVLPPSNPVLLASEQSSEDDLQLNATGDEPPSKRKCLSEVSPIKLTLQKEKSSAQWISQIVQPPVTSKELPTSEGSCASSTSHTTGTERMHITIDDDDDEDTQAEEEVEKSPEVIVISDSSEDETETPATSKSAASSTGPSHRASASSLSVTTPNSLGHGNPPKLLASKLPSVSTSYVSSDSYLMGRFSVPSATTHYMSNASASTAYAAGQKRAAESCSYRISSSMPRLTLHPGGNNHYTSSTDTSSYSIPTPLSSVRETLSGGVASPYRDRLSGPLPDLVRITQPYQPFSFEPWTPSKSSLRQFLNPALPMPSGTGGHPSSSSGHAASSHSSTGGDSSSGHSAHFHHPSYPSFEDTLQFTRVCDMEKLPLSFAISAPLTTTSVITSSCAPTTISTISQWLQSEMIFSLPMSCMNTSTLSSQQHPPSTQTKDLPLSTPSPAASSHQPRLTPQLSLASDDLWQQQQQALINSTGYFSRDLSPNNSHWSGSNYLDPSGSPFDNSGPPTMVSPQMLAGLDFSNTFGISLPEDFGSQLHYSQQLFNSPLDLQSASLQLLNSNPSIYPPPGTSESNSTDNFGTDLIHLD